MAFYCNGKKGICDKHPVCTRTCEHFDNTGGKHIDGLDSKHITTNADRIRAMSDEELAEVFGKLVHCGGCPMRDNCKVDDLPCNNVLLEWLKQHAEGE